MATITEDARVITINNSSYLPNTPPTLNNLPKYTFAVVTPTVRVDFLTLEEAHLWLPAIAVRHVTKEVARAHYTNKIKALQISNPEFFKRAR